MVTSAPDELKTAVVAMTTEHKTDEVFKTEIIPAELNQLKLNQRIRKTHKSDKQNYNQINLSWLMSNQKRMNLLWMSQLLS